METIRNLINKQTNNISFCGDTEEVLKQDALEDIKEFKEKMESDETIWGNSIIIDYIKFKYNLNEEE